MAKKVNLDSEDLNVEEVSLTRKQLKEIQKKAKQAEKEERKRLKESKTGQKYKAIQSTQMALPIQDVYHGIVITKDNRFIKILEFQSQNIMMYSHEKRNSVDYAFESALRVFPVKVQFKVFSRKADVEALIGSMKEHRSTETVPECQALQEEYIDFLHRVAMQEGVSRRFLAIIEYDDPFSYTNNSFEKVEASLCSTASRVRSYMEQCGNEFISRCETDAGITELLYDILNRKKAFDHPFETRVNNVMKKYLADREKGNRNFLNIPTPELFAPGRIDYRHPKYIVVDGKFYTFGYITGNGYEANVALGWLSYFVNACEGIDVDVFLERIPKEKVRESIAYRVAWNRSKVGKGSDLAAGVTENLNSIDSGIYLLDGLSSDQDFYYSSILITVCCDSLKVMTSRYLEVEKAARSYGLKMQRTNYQMEEAFNSALPICNLDRNIFKKARRNMLSSGAASMYPFISYELQDKDGIMIGSNSANGSLVTVNIFDTSAHTNANVAIMGQSGYGKTFTAQLFALRMRLQHKQVFIITPAKGKNDYFRTCNSIRGQFVSMGPGSPYCINIMDIRLPDNGGLDEDEMTRSALAMKVQSLHAFMGLVVRDLQQEEEQLIDGLLFQVYNDYGITEDNSSLFVEGTTQYKKMPVLGDLYNKIQTVPELKRIGHILFPMISGSMSAYNKRTNIDLSNQYIVFDMDGMQGESLILSMFIVLDFVWSKIKENHLVSKAVFIDEAWKLIGSESNEMAAEYVKEIFKTIRSYGGSAFVMTQEVSDFFSLKGGVYGNAIIGNCDTKVILHLDSRETKTLAALMPITSNDMERIGKLQRGNGLFLTGNNKLYVQFNASRYEQNIITTDSMILRGLIKKEKAAINKAKQTVDAESVELDDGYGDE